MVAVEHRPQVAVRAPRHEDRLHRPEVVVWPKPAPPAGPSVAPAPAHLPYRRGLDGLRGLAVAAVVGYHLGVPGMGGGFLGVSLFFTLSGFLITNLLLAERTARGTISLGGFWGRRARRLLPAALAGVLLAVAATAVAGTAGQLQRLPGDVLAAVSYSANWRFVLDHSTYAAGYQAPSPLLHYWSLAIEEQAYLILPILVLLVARGTWPRRRLAIAVVGLMAASAGLTLALGRGADPNRVYFGTDTRSFELLAGVLLAVVVGMRRVRLPRGTGAVAVVLMLGLWATVGEGDRWLYRGGLWLVTAVSCGVIMTAAGTGWMGRLLAWRPLVELGRRSYGVYVYHWPLFLLLGPATTGLTGLGLGAVRVGATAAVAGASFRWLEQPIRQRRGRFTRPMITACGLAPIAAVLAAVLVAGAAPPRAVAAAARTPILLGAGASPVPGPAAPPLHRVLFVGDSLMQEAYPTFAARLGATGVLARSIGHPGESLWSKAPVWLPAIRRSVATFDPDVVVLESCCGHFASDPPWIGPSGRPADPASPAFFAGWSGLATQATEIASARGAVVLWVLAPPTHTNGWYGPIDGQIPAINAIYRSVTACAPGTGTVDWGLISGPARSYAARLRDSSGRLVTVRDADGFHFTRAGWDLQADVTLPAIRAQWAAHGGRVAPWQGACGQV